MSTSQWSSNISLTTKSSYIPNSEEARITANDKTANWRFGSSVSVDATGTRVAIGSMSADRSAYGGAGVAYIFIRSGTTWTQEAKIMATSYATGDHFGASISIDATGTRVVVGAPDATRLGLSGCGVCFIFTRSGTTWTQEAEIVANDKAANDEFGASISSDSTCTRIIVGSPRNAGGLVQAGAAYIFIRSGTSWSQEAKLLASDKVSYDNAAMARSIDIDDNGTRSIIGVYQSDPGGLNAAGAAYVFVRSGTIWSQEAKLTASDKTAVANFGRSASINGDGTRCIVGAPQADPGGISNAGAAYVFVRSGTTWTQEAILIATDKVSSDALGNSVYMNANGDRIVTGASAAASGGIYSGVAYVFDRSGTTWTQSAKLTPSGATNSDAFGLNVSIASNSSRIVVGSEFSDPSSLSSAGSVYIYS